ncbi:hypothetical protein [Arthrobacter sp. Z1-15]
MSKQGKGIAVGIGMVVFGVVLYVVFGHIVKVETPVIGLRQTGAVIAVLGIIELVALQWGGARRRGDDLL